VEAPNVIKLLGYRIVVKFCSVVLVDNATALGAYIQEKTEIQIKSGMSKSAEQNTVLHEVMHAILQEYELDSEELVRVVTPALLGLLKDNPALVDYLTS
jgi:Zn-dependent peptidase ImmA (M78 family)